MYEAFYGFKEKPFSMLPDPGFLFLSKKHQAALTLLEYGLLNHVGFCVISGEAGAGKTTILRALLERVGDDITVGLITNTHQSFGGLLDWVLSAFDLHRPNLTHVEMHQIFMDYLIEEYANNRTVLLIVDEAQNMKPDALEELRMLSNVNSAKDQLMQVVLAGQPALKATLRTPELMQFAQRIAVDYHLEALSVKETCGYIQHRLVTAGAQNDVFTPAACERIHNYSGGTPRLINLLCETVLVYGFADQQKRIDVDLVDEMVQERMKDSVVPIVNRDIAKQDNKERSKALEKDFPWIRPEGGTAGLKPSAHKKTGDSGPADASSERARAEETPKRVAGHEKPAVVSVRKAGIENKAAAAVIADDDKPLHVLTNRGKGRPPDKKTATKTNTEKAALKKNDKLTTTSANAGKREAGKQFFKYGLIAVVLALLLIALAFVLNSEAETKSEMVADDTIEMRKQREQDEARVKQLQIETEALKKERDAALKKVEQEKRAKQEAEDQAKREAEKLAAEKAAVAVKAAQDKRKLEEKKRIAQAKARESRAKQAEAKAIAEAESAKREAVRLEEERRIIKARLDEEIRLKEQQEARRLELEFQEKQRQALLESERIIEQQAVAEEAAAAAKLKKKLAECTGPTARFKSACR